MSEKKEKKAGNINTKVSRRKFLEGTATAAFVTTAARSAAAQNGGTTGAGNQNRTQTAAPALRGEMIEYKSGDISIPAYLSRNKKGTPKGAVLVIHEVFGLNDHIKSIADRISAEGYLALAPNFFVRAAQEPPKDDKDMAALRKAASSIPTEVAIKDMQAGLDFMKTLNKRAPRMVSIGWCMGGGFSYQIATHTKDLAGAVIFYGRTLLELVPQVSCPLLGNFGELDQGIPPDKVKEFEAALKKAGKQADIKIYPGAKHGFFNDTRPEAYNAEAAADAWQRTLKFFRARMKG
ncbi:MAG TPA: dienelactone hydrolase family protein [Pyrinomonadaceae bacterium]|jgi:carboxymethylenebutenolidase|nr:dienelactone hydrolase family protein [Pyrinomonadaceae bacterium]